MKSFIFEIILLISILFIPSTTRSNNVYKLNSHIIDEQITHAELEIMMIQDSLALQISNIKFVEHEYIQNNNINSELQEELINKIQYADSLLNNIDHE